MRKALVCLVFFVFITTVLFCQENKYPQDLFVPPVDFRMLLSGTFGELRGGHFHSGIDIKTQKVEGKNIYAIADGYVARIKVSPYGFGKALYIIHPNGYTSVYAHLKAFNDSIEEYVKRQQYKKQSFAIELFPGKNQFKVKKGKLIAFSGNSGGSYGPHLHFEIRDTKSEKPLNPMLFGFKIKDYIRPKIQSLKIYPADQNTLINGENKAFHYAVEGWGEKHRLAEQDTVTVSGNAYFGIETYDLLNDANNKNGVYSIKLKVDSNLIYSHDMTSFSFYETRYINSLIDYAYYTDAKRRIQRSTIDPNNKLSIYNHVENDGIFSFTDTATHFIEYEVRDSYNNLSRLQFHVYAEPAKTETLEMKNAKPIEMIRYDQDFQYKDENVSISIPKNSLYRDCPFELQIDAANNEFISDLFKINTEKVPVHKRYTISIPVNEKHHEYSNQIILVKISEKEESAYTGKVSDGIFSASVRDFGVFGLKIDSIPPKIKALNIHNGKKINDYKSIRIKITDEEAGINTYNAYLNNKWVLMEYDAKNDLLIYSIDEAMKSGTNTLKLVISDDCDNKSEESWKLIY